MTDFEDENDTNIGEHCINVPQNNDIKSPNIGMARIQPPKGGAP